MGALGVYDRDPQTRDLLRKEAVAGLLEALAAPQRADVVDTEYDERQCEAETARGTRCKRDAEPGSAFCRQHGDADAPEPDEAGAPTPQGEGA